MTKLKGENPVLTTVRVETPVTLKQIASILCTGFEGGIGYWGQIVKYVKPPKLTYTTEKLDGRDDKTVFKHIDYPINEGGVVVVKDIEDPEGPEFELDLTAIKHGVKVMAEKYPEHFQNWMTENDDAITGDVFIQCCLFGEAIYG